MKSNSNVQVGPIFVGSSRVDLQYFLASMGRNQLRPPFTAEVMAQSPVKSDLSAQQLHRVKEQKLRLKSML